MAPQASKQATENYAARGRREKRDSREKRNPKFRVRSSENSTLRTQHSELPIGSCTSIGIDSEQVPGTFLILTMSSLSSQASVQRENRFLTLFLNPVVAYRQNPHVATTRVASKFEKHFIATPIQAKIFSTRSGFNSEPNHPYTKLETMLC